MASIIEKSLQEYLDFLAGDNSNVEIIEAEIEYNQPCARQPLESSNGCFVVKIKADRSNRSDSPF
nr:hypothetical protein [Limosilactobacillus mucosae]